MIENLIPILTSALYGAVLLVLTAFGLHRYFILYLYRKHRRSPMLPAGKFDRLPTVTVQLPIFNEIHVARRLLESVAKLDYPADRLEIQVLDDSTDETRALAADLTAELRAAGHDICHLHRENRIGYKAGALDAGLKAARGEFVLILDADFLPPPDLLQKTIHHFTDPGIGMIQTRWGHINRVYSLLTRIQSVFLDGHLLLEQTARSRSGRFFNFNGTGGLWRRTCIEAAGGWQHDTLTEDLDLSYRAQLEGWRFVFLPDVTTPAELPVEMNGFKSQQHRWTKGSIQTCKKLLPRIWRSPLPLPVKLEATIHLTTNFVYSLVVLLCFLLIPGHGNGPSLGLAGNLPFNIFVFCAVSVSAAVYYLFAQRELYPREWKLNLALLPLLLGVGIGLSLNNTRAVLEAMCNHQSEFTRTPKYGIRTGQHTWRRGRYLPIRSFVTLVECVFTTLFFYFFVESLWDGNYLSAPFLLLFVVGFGYVAVLSVAQMMPCIRRFQGPDILPEGAEPA